MNKNKKLQGSVLIVSMMVLSIILIITMSLTLVSIREEKNATGEAGSSNAFQTADSGIEITLLDILKGGHSKVNQLTNCQSSDGTIKNGNYVVQLLDASGNIILCNSNTSIVSVAELKSTGNVSGQSRAIVAVVPSVSGTVSRNGITYGIVKAEDGNFWLDRNLGATEVATSSTDAAAYGWLFQWGRIDDGHQVPTSGTTLALSHTDTPGNNLFIKHNPSMNLDWRQPQNSNLWQGGGSAINNPCPPGFRLPTIAEWTNLASVAHITDSATAFASVLKLPVAGGRDIDSTLFSTGSEGFYWASDVVVHFFFGDHSECFEFNLSSIYYSEEQRALGYSVRCIKD